MGDKAPIIVIKKKKGAHGGAHGGAWKVAYADFVTAMMAFFMVMWLLGSDEEIKASVASYFNNPTSAWRPDLGSKDQMPLGELTGAGDGLLKGNDGQVPEDLVERPGRPYSHHVDKPAQTGDLLEDALGEDSKYMNVEILNFTLDEKILFTELSDSISEDGARILKRLHKMMKGFQGKLSLFGYTDPPRTEEAESFEFTNSRLSAIKKYLLKNHLIDEERILTKVKNVKVAERAMSSEPQKVTTRKIDFRFVQ